MQQCALVAVIAGVPDLSHADVLERVSQPAARILARASGAGSQGDQAPLSRFAPLLAGADLGEGAFREHDAGGGHVVVGNAAR